MAQIASFFALAVCAVLCSAQPVDKLPVLKQLPNELVFREGKEFILECVTEAKEDGIKYKWIKDGKPFTPTSEVAQRDNEGTLVFKNPNKNDEGEYQCLAETTLGVASSKANVRRAYIEAPAVNLQKHKPEEGKTYKLECKIPKSYPKPVIVWISQSSDAKKEVQGQRFTVSDEGDLYFSNITKEDAENTKYICVGKSPAVDSDVVLAEHVLEGIVPQRGGDNEVVQQYVTKDTTLKVGDSVYLYCIYGGNPLAHPDWFKDGKDINNSHKDRVTRYNKSVGKRLIIKAVLPEDEGSYTCTVDNEIGKPQKHSFNVKIVGAPKFEQQPEPKIVVKQGDTVKISCQIFGIPKPTLSWTYNTGSVPQKIQAASSNVGNSANSELIINNAQKSDSGYYGCKGLNEFGEVYAETLVFVQ